MNHPCSWRSLGAWGLAATLTGCLPAAEPQPSTSLAGDALGALHAQYGVAAQVFTYNPQRVDVFRTASGGVLATGSQAFLDLSSSSPAPGPLRLEVREVLTRADMLLSGRPSMGNGQVLESGGQFLVQASTADNRLLRLSPHVKLGLATPIPARLSAYYAIMLYAPDAPGNLAFNWVPATDTASSVGTSPALYTGDPVYFRCLIAKGLYDSNGGWLSFAQPIYTGYAPVGVRVRTGQSAADAANSAVYLVFHDYNAVAQLAPSGRGNFELATVLALYSAAGKLYFGQREDTVRAGRTFDVTLTERNTADVVAELKRFQ